jgi:hypothetical protein
MMLRSVLNRAGRREDKALHLLDRERAVLLRGPIGELEALVARREAVMAEILADTRPPSAAFVEALRVKAERNSRLLLASIAGLRAGREQVESAGTAGQRLRTYTAQGQALEVNEGAATRDSRR